MNFSKEVKGKKAIAERLKKKALDNADLPDNADASAIIYRAVGLTAKRSIQERMSNASRLIRTVLTLDPYEEHVATKAQVETALQELVEINGVLVRYINDNQALEKSLPVQKKNSIRVLSEAYHMRSETRGVISNYYEPAAFHHERSRSEAEVDKIKHLNSTYLEESINDAVKCAQLQTSLFVSFIGTVKTETPNATTPPTAEVLIKKGIINFASSSFGDGLEKFKQVQAMGPENATMLFDRLYEKRRYQDIEDRVLWDKHLKEIVSTFTPEQKTAWRALKKEAVPAPAIVEEPVVMAKVEVISPATKPDNIVGKEIILAAADVTTDDNGPWIEPRKGKKLPQQASSPAGVSAVSKNTQRTDIIPKEIVAPAILPAVEFTEEEYPRLQAPVKAETKQKAKKERKKTAKMLAETPQPDSVVVEADAVPNIEPSVPSAKVSAVSNHQRMQPPKHEELLQDVEEVRSFLRGLIGKDNITPTERGQCLGLHHSSNLDIRFLVDAYRLREKGMLTTAEIEFFDRRIFGTENPILLSNPNRQPTSNELEFLRGLATSSPKPDNVALRKGFVEKYVNKVVEGAATQAVLGERGGQISGGRG